MGPGSPVGAPGRNPPPPALRAGLGLVSGLARGLGPVRYAIADGAALCAYALHPEAASRTARNHRRAAPELDRRAARRLARASFRAYGRMAADTLWVSGARGEEVLARTGISGWDQVEAARREGRGVVLAMCHQGSWDMALAVGLAAGLRIAAVMAPVGPPWMTDLVAWERRRRGLQLLSLDRAARGFVRTLVAGHFVGVMVDIPESGPVAEVPFCGGPVRFSAAAAWLALRTGAPILPVSCWRRRGGWHLLEVGEAIRAGTGDDETTITGRVAAALELAVRREAGQWYPFHRVYTDDHD